MPWNRIDFKLQGSEGSHGIQIEDIIDNEHF